MAPVVPLEVPFAESIVLQRLLESTHDGVIVRDAAGRTVFANAHAEAVLGLSRAQLFQAEPPQKNWKAVREDGSTLTLDDSPGSRTLRTGEPYRGVIHRVHLPDGTLRWMRITSEPLRSPDGGALAGVLIILEDITMTRQLEESLLRHEHRLAAVLETSEIGSWDWDFTSGSAARSLGVYAILGYQPSEMGTDAASWYSLVHPEDRPRIAEQYSPARLAGANEVDVEYRLRHRDGTWRWVRSYGRVVRRSAKGEALQITGTLRDVTERRTLEDALRVERARVAQLEALLQGKTGTGR